MVGFKKILGYRVILLITINSIIGSGMFFLPAIGAKIAGPMSIISWGILSLIAIYTSMVFAEMVAMYPKAGGIYEFCKHAYGSFWSFIIGWVAWIVGNVTTAMLIVGAVQYLLPYSSPLFLILKIVISLFWVILFNLMAYRGMKTSSFMLVTFAIITVSIIILLVVPGIFNADPGKLIPFFVSSHPMENLSMIVLTIFFISEAFFGLESVMFLAEETKNPETVLPRALINGTIIIAILTMVLVTISLMVVPWVEFGSSSAPFAEMASRMLGSVFKEVIILGTYLVILGAAAGWIVTGPRLIVSLTRDKMFPPKFGLMHPMFDSPYNAIKFQAAVTCILVLVGFSGEGYKTLLAVLVPLVLIMMSASILAVVILRIRQPDVERPYKVPIPYVGPIIIVLINLFLIGTWLTVEHNAFAILSLGLSTILVGIPIYVYLQIQYNPGSLTKLNDFFAYFNLLGEQILVPKDVRKKIIGFVGGLKGKTVLEFGCSVGTFTLNLAKEVGKFGRVYATDLSGKSINITKVRLLKMGFSHVSTIHDREHSIRVHPEVPNVDVVASISVLGNTEKVDKVLVEMNRRMKIGDKLCFVEYDKFFHLLSNINWLSDNAMIKHIFRRNGFLINVERDTKLLWQIVYIYGKKVMEVDENHMKERIVIDDVNQNLSTLEFNSFLKNKILDYKERLFERDISFIFYDDPNLDKLNFNVNKDYFDRIYAILLDVAFFSCLSNGNIIFTVKKDDTFLKVNMLISMDNSSIVLYLNDSELSHEENHDFHEHKLELNFLRRLVSLGYKGDLNICQIKETHDPAIHKRNLREFIYGVYEEEIIEKGQDYLCINIDIPLEKITEF